MSTITKTQRATVEQFTAAADATTKAHGDLSALARKVYGIDPDVKVTGKGTDAATLIVRGETFPLSKASSTTVASVISRTRTAAKAEAMTPAERKRAEADAERNKANKAAKAADEAKAAALQAITLTDLVTRLAANIMQVSDADFRTLVLAVGARQKREREAAATKTAANGK